jgi:acyl dehydratase
VETPGRTITETDVVNFAALSGDHNPLHTNTVFAEKGPFGARIAHGLLGLAVTSGLIAQLGLFEDSVIAFREMTCKFRQPVFIGDTVCARAEVTSSKPIPKLGGGMIELEVRLYNQDEEAVQSGRWRVVLRSKPDL